MSKSKISFKMIDKSVFDAVNDLEKSEFYEKLVAAFDSIDGPYRKIVKKGLAFLVIILPLLLTLWVYRMQSRETAHAASYSRILNSINQIKNKLGIANSTKAFGANKSQFSSISSLKSTIKRSARQYSLKSENIVIVDFAITTDKNGVRKSGAAIQFSGLTAQDFSNFLRLINGLRSSVVKLETNRTSADLLVGTIDLEASLGDSK